MQLPQYSEFTGSTVEPLFVLTYYATIITQWFSMPSQRYSEIHFGFGGAGGGGGTTTTTTTTGASSRLLYTWITPSAVGMVMGVIIYSAILLFAAYLIYKVKQAKT